MPTFQKATKQQIKLRMALDGPSGSGKTYTALVAAKAMANGGKVAVIDTERGSASLYADLFDFDVCELTNFAPANYISAIEAAEQAGYKVIVIDSLSHAWEGEGGVLDMHDDAVKRQRTENSYTAWKDVTPLHRRLVDAMLQSKCHIVATMRSKTEYALETVDGKTKVKKIGLAPIQRQGMEYEFTIVGDLDLDHNLVISKSRMASLADKVENKPGEKFFKQVVDWLNSGQEQKADPIKAQEQPKAQPAPEPTYPHEAGEVDKEENEDPDYSRVMNSDGIPYTDIPTGTLSNMYNSMAKALKKNDVTDEYKATTQMKLDAAKAIIKSRQ